MSCVFTGDPSDEFVLISSAGAVYSINFSSWAAALKGTATGMNQLNLGTLVMASASAGTTTPLWSSPTDLAVWTASTAAGASCRNFIWSGNFSRWYGLANTNAGTALYHSASSAGPWTLATVAAYGIGITGIDTGDGSFCIAATNSTAANTASNLQRLATATTFDTNCGIPHAGATSFAFGEVSGKMFACNTGANTIHQALVHDGTGWRTLRGASANGNFSLADRIFDLGNNVGLIARSSNQPERTTNANATDPTWAAMVLFANQVIHNPTGPVTIAVDGGAVRRSTDRMATFPLITNSSDVLNRGFAYRGHGIVFDGFYWFPGNDVQGYAAFAKCAVGSETDGVNWTIESTAFDNAQFDFAATNGTIALALNTASGVVWKRAIGGTWQQSSQSSLTAINTWRDLLWCSGRGRFAAMNQGNLADGAKALWFSPDGERWEEGGDNSQTMNRLGYSATLDQFFTSANAAGSTPIESEIKTFNNATQFRLFQDLGKGINVTTYSKAT